MTAPVQLQVNGRTHALAVGGHVPLLQVLRNDLGLNGPKYGCGLGECGACAVLIDGVAARSCCIPLDGVAGRKVTTLEGLGQGGVLHPVQQAFIDTQAAQCGYCLNGMLMATVALLQRHPRPTDAQARTALQHHLCRCGTHIEILAAVQHAAELLAESSVPSTAGAVAGAPPDAPSEPGGPA